MRKYILGFAALSLLYIASSCNKETIETADGQNQIKFQTFLGKQTKASEMNLLGLQIAANDNANGIAVRAYRDDAAITEWKSWSLWYNTTPTPAEWTYGTPVLQPNFDLVYYAWYPTTTVATLNGTSSGTSASFNYTVPAVGYQEDLLAARVGPTLNADIDLQFAHLLSQVNFSLLTVEDVKIKINSITLSNVNSVATYSFQTGWGTPTTSAPYVYDLSGATFPTNAVIFPATPATVSLGTGTNGLMLMPQTFGTTSTAIFTINFTLQDVDNNYLAGTAGAGETAIAYLKDFTVSTWAPGTRYNYLIDFTNYLADRYIKFDVKVTDWVNSTPAVQYVEVAQANKTSIEGAVTSLSAWDTGVNEVFQITAKGTLTANLALTIDPADFNTGDKIVIYIGGLATYDITAADWSASKGGGNTYVTLTKD